MVVFGSRQGVQQDLQEPGRQLPVAPLVPFKMETLMSHTPHELADEFPDMKDKIHDLKMNDAHFARLAEQYHEVNRQIHRIEAEVEPTSDAHAEELKKQRLALKDEIAAMLSAEEEAVEEEV